MTLVCNIFLFFGFFFTLLIHRRNVENLCILEKRSFAGESEEPPEQVRPVPKAWFLLSLVSFFASYFIRIVVLPA